MDRGRAGSRMPAAGGSRGEVPTSMGSEPEGEGRRACPVPAAPEPQGPCGFAKLEAEVRVGLNFRAERVLEAPETSLDDQGRASPGHRGPASWGGLTRSPPSALLSGVT